MTPPGGPLRLRPLSAPPAVAWLSETGLRPAQVSAPVLEVHLLPVEGTGLIGATGLTAAAGGLARDFRLSGFVTDREPLDVGSDNQRAWAVRAPASSGGWRERTVEQFWGLIAEASGASAAFLSLPTDLAGALVDQPTLQRDIARLVALAAPHVAAANQVVPAVGPSDAERVWAGDPTRVGSRNGGSMRTRRGLAIRVGPEFSVDRDQLVEGIGDMAAELAARVLNDVRQLPAY